MAPNTVVTPAPSTTTEVAEALPTCTDAPKANPYKRHVTKTPGIAYRLRAKGGRTYLVRFEGDWLAVQGGYEEARAYKTHLESKKTRGERVVLPKKVSFGQVAERWFEEAKH